MAPSYVVTEMAGDAVATTAAWAGEHGSLAVCHSGSVSTVASPMAHTLSALVARCAGPRVSTRDSLRPADRAAVEGTRGTTAKQIEMPDAVTEVHVLAGLIDAS